MGRTSDARERLLESGTELMHARGYTAVGVSEICAAAGVKKGSFYYFFPSKADLALEVIERSSEGQSALLAELADDDSPPLDRLSCYLSSVYDHLVEKRRTCGKVLGCPLGNMALEMSTQDRVLRDRLRIEFDGIIDGLAELLDQAVERRDLERIDTRASAGAVLALVEGRIMMAKMQNDPEILTTLQEEVFRLIGARSNSQA